MMQHRLAAYTRPIMSCPFHPSKMSTLWTALVHLAVFLYGLHNSSSWRPHIAVTSIPRKKTTGQLHPVVYCEEAVSCIFLLPARAIPLFLNLSHSWCHLEETFDSIRIAVCIVELSEVFCNVFRGLKKEGNLQRTCFSFKELSDVLLIFSKWCNNYWAYRFERVAS